MYVNQTTGEAWGYAKVVIRYSPNAPDYCATARVNGRGLWRATLRPDIEHKPSEWGRVVVVRPFATNRGRLLADAKLDGVIDYPNCRSRGGQPLHPWGSLMCGDCRSALPLTLIVYHTWRQKSRGFRKKCCTKFK